MKLKKNNKKIGFVLICIGIIIAVVVTGCNKNESEKGVVIKSEGYETQKVIDSVKEFLLTYDNEKWIKPRNYDNPEIKYIAEGSKDALNVFSFKTGEAITISMPVISVAFNTDSLSYPTYFIEIKTYKVLGFLPGS